MISSEVSLQDFMSSLNSSVDVGDDETFSSDISCPKLITSHNPNSSELEVSSGGGW
jgi:hypothetical protein